MLEANYQFYDGFVILHGTDTLSYTASALSFMLENFNKTVVLTGAKIPLFEHQSDSVDNLLGALTIAGHYNIPEVCIYFNFKLLRGNRSTKENTGLFDTFSSVNFP